MISLKMSFSRETTIWGRKSITGESTAAFLALLKTDREI